MTHANAGFAEEPRSRVRTSAVRAVEPAPQTRAERLIAVARIILAGVALLAVWLDPTQPRHDALAAYSSLAGFLAYAAAILVLVARAPAPPAWVPLATQILDSTLSPILMYLTEGPASPFFVYFLFPILSATLRWQTRGMLWTAGGSLVVFLGLGVVGAHTAQAADFQTDLFIIRSAFLSVLAVLLAALGAHARWIRAELLRLAAGPRAAPVEAEALASEALSHAVSVVPAPRVVLAWEDSEEPWLWVAWRHEDRVGFERHAPDEWLPLVAEPLAEAAFLSNGTSEKTRVLLRRGAEKPARWTGAPVHAGFAGRFTARAVLSAPFAGEEANGRLFWLDDERMTADDLALAQVVAGQLAPLFDQLQLQRRLRETAVAQERVRLARDLHDGLLQTLAASALQLQSAIQALATDPESARRSLSEVRRLLTAEQRDLRWFIREARPGAPAAGARLAPLGARLAELAERVRRHWGLQVEVGGEGLQAPLGHELSQQVYLLVHEAVMNAARHSGGSHARVRIEAGGGSLRIEAGDDGRGFPWRGRRLAAALPGRGPVSLGERVSALGGTLVIDSSEAGARVEMTLPLRPLPGEGR